MASREQALRAALQDIKVADRLTKTCQNVPTLKAS
jgi:hypothetical protein